MIKGLDELQRLYDQATRHFNFRIEKERMLIQRFSDYKSVVEKSLKALEIIKTKKVQVGWLFKNNFDSLGHYNCVAIALEHYEKLTQEEYDLLKEVLL